MKKIVLLAILITSVAFSQKNINNYKYIIVPNQFDFVKQADKYQTSSLTKFLFKKKGFTTFLSSESLPDELAKNRCLALTANVKDNSGMFTTKSVIELKDCNNNIVLTSVEGKSKQKEFKKAYHEAIRGAFTTIQRVNYKYFPLKNRVEVKTESVPVVVETPKVVNQSSEISTAKEENVLYAQATAYGFQLVNTKPEVVFQILKTNVNDVYVIKDKNGILYKNEDIWVAEYYSEGKKKTKKYSIKF